MPSKYQTGPVETSAEYWAAEWDDPTLLPAGHRIPAGLTFSTVRPDLDFETYSEAGKTINLQTGKVTGKGLGEVGTPVYAEHPSCDVLCFSYDLKDGKGKRRWATGYPDPQDLLDHVARAAILQPTMLLLSFGSGIWSAFANMAGRLFNLSSSTATWQKRAVFLCLPRLANCAPC